SVSRLPRFAQGPADSSRDSPQPPGGVPRSTYDGIPPGQEVISAEPTTVEGASEPVDLRVRAYGQPGHRERVGLFGHDRVGHRAGRGVPGVPPLTAYARAGVAVRVGHGRDRAAEPVLDEPAAEAELLAQGHLAELVELGVAVPVRADLDSR